MRRPFEAADFVLRHQVRTQFDHDRAERIRRAVAQSELRAVATRLRRVAAHDALVDVVAFGIAAAVLGAVLGWAVFH